jgi:hypothetical protein
MSTLLEQASLVLIPSGYKEDTVFSAIPTDGSGDLSFTRASNGTRINSAGLVEVCPWNLVQQSETFDNVSWAKNTGGTSTVTVTANSGIAPNGTTTADRIQLTRDSLGFAQVIQTVTTTTSQSYTFSVYLKSLSGTPTVMFGSFGGTNTQTATLTNEWVRYTWTATSPSTSAFALLMIWGGVGSTSLSADFLAWGYQLVEGSTAKPYFPTTDRLNVPRLTYQNGGGGCPSLLLEKQSTNILLNSGELNSWLQIDTSVTSNSTISPDGTQNADTVTATGSGSLAHLIYQNLSFTSGTAYTYSVFAKANTSNFVQIVFSGDFVLGSYANFDLSNGTITASANLTPKIESMGNGWYRCSVSATAGVSSANSQIIYLINSGTASRGQAFTANGESVYLWGGQFEASSYPTSYIPTTSSSATRVADVTTKTGIASLIGSTEGVLFVEADMTLNSATDGIFIDVNDNNLTNRVLINISNNVIGGFVQGSNRVSYTIPSSGRYKIAFGYKSGDFVLYVNGVQRSTSSASVTFSGMNQIFLGHTFAGTTTQPSDPIAQAILFKTRLTNAELASLTTI